MWSCKKEGWGATVEFVYVAFVKGEEYSEDSNGYTCSTHGREYKKSTLTSDLLSALH